MIIVEDTNQKTDKHGAVNEYFAEHGIEVIRQRLPCGDYVAMNDKMADVFDRKARRKISVKMMDLIGTYNVCVDEKYSIQELCQNVCGPQHARFRDELVLAQNNGIKLYVVVRNDPEVIHDNDGVYVANKTITSLDKLSAWINPRLWIRRRGQQLYPRATKGVTLMKSCFTLQKKYGCEIILCSSKDAGAKIVELLTTTSNQS